MTSVALIGAGFGGGRAAVVPNRAGYDDVTMFERGERLGGVWHHNTYPGPPATSRRTCAKRRAAMWATVWHTACKNW